MLCCSILQVGGSSKKNQDVGERWLLEHPAESKELLRRLTTVVVEYLSAQVLEHTRALLQFTAEQTKRCPSQVEAGAHMLQVFEAMGMMITPPSFQKYALPCMVEVTARIVVIVTSANNRQPLSFVAELTRLLLS